MFCKKCGKEIEENVKYCRFCGANVGNQENTESINQNDENLDEELKRAYIGEKNTEKWLNKIYCDKWKFSFEAVLFGPFYFIYRKMYLYGFLGFLIITILNIFLSGDLSKWIVWLAEGFLFYPIWKYHISTKIYNLKNSNPNMTNEELINKAKKEGGTTAMAYVLLAIYIVLAIIVSLISMGLN